MTTTQTDQHQAERTARAYLSHVFEPGDPDVVAWINADGPIAASHSLQRGDPPETIRARAGMRHQDFLVGDDMRRAQQVGGRFVIPEDEEWPDQLGDRYVGLWVRGAASLRTLSVLSVAVVGARASTAYGEHAAAELAHGLATRGWTVIAGGALGVDAAAHRGALAAAGPTIVVLANGIDRAYPAAHSALFARIVEDGGLLVSQFPPGAAPLRHRFLTRNRLTAELSNGTVMVEAAYRSGTTQTLAAARDLGRPFMAVPGPITSAQSVGCHTAIREGAQLVTSAAEVIAHVAPAAVTL